MGVCVLQVEVGRWFTVAEMTNVLVDFLFFVSFFLSTIVVAVRLE